MNSLVLFFTELRRKKSIIASVITVVGLSVLLFGVNTAVIIWPVILVIITISAFLSYFRNLLLGMVFGVFVIFAITLGRQPLTSEESRIEVESEVSSIELDVWALYSDFHVEAGSSKLLEVESLDSAKRYTIGRSLSDDRKTKLFTIRPQYTQLIRSAEEKLSVNVPDIPVSLVTKIQFSKALLDLQKITITHFTLKAASAEITIIMPQSCTDCTLRYEAWSTKTNIKIPKGTAISIDSEHPSVGVKFPEKNFNNASHLESDNYQTADKKYHVDIKGSTGSIEISEYTVE